jgi:CheY-like chemotaxis protein
MADLNKVFHVEDEPDILEITRLALTMVGGLELEQFSNGNDAVAAVAELRPDMFLLDQMMPVINGEETLIKLRQVPGFEDTPAVFMTAQSNDAVKLLLQNSTAVAVISKPFDPMTLAEQLKTIWAEHVERTKSKS